MYSLIRMAYRGQEHINDVRGQYLKAGSTYTGMTSDIFIRQHIRIYNELHLTGLVIHKPHNAHCPGLNIKKAEHI